MKSEAYTSSKDTSTVSIVSPPSSNFFLIILEFFNNIQLILIIYINKLMVLIFLHLDKTK
jgi:hypothetical protein